MRAEKFSYSESWYYFRGCRPRRPHQVEWLGLDVGKENAGGLALIAGKRHRRPVSDSTIRKDLRNLSAFFSRAVPRGYLGANPVKGVSPPGESSKEIEVPTPQQLVTLLAALERPALGSIDAQAWHLFILVGAVTGIDRDDLLELVLSGRANVYPRLKLGELDTAGIGLITHVRNKTRRTKPKPRYHGLPKEVSDRLAVRISHLPSTSHLRLFPWRRYQRNQWAAICKAAGFKLRYKDLRRFFGTSEAEAAALTAAAGQLGHSDPKTARDHYVSNPRLALAFARRLELPTGLPPLPAYRPPAHAETPPPGSRRSG